MKNHILSILLLCFLFSNSYGFQQDSIPKKEQKLPTKKRVIDTLSDEFKENPLKEYNEAYYIVNRLNKALGFPPNQINLQTPQATLEHFIIQSRNNNFENAAYALNVNLLPDDITSEEISTLAEKLYFVLNQRIKIDWHDISDRPDGQVDITTTTNQSVAGKPRKSITFGVITVDGRDIEFRLQRIKYQNEGPIWLISSNTVENIEELYEIYGPRKLDLMIPSWASFDILNVPAWKIFGTLVLLFLAFVIGRLTNFIINRTTRNSEKKWVTNFAKKLAKPAGIAIGILFFYILLNELISFTGKFAVALYTTILIAVIASITWFVMRLIDYLLIHTIEENIGDTNPEGNDEARMKLTYISVARRITTFIVTIIGIIVILSQFESFEKLGISLLASAGLATVILGIAAQNTLGNIIAGIQIAMTRPAKIGDTIIVDDDWGYVEDIKFTYMVVRTWDLRRLVVPLQYLISNVFENWSMTSPHQIRSIFLHADYRIDVKKLRQKFKELVEAEDLWDGENDPILQVVDVTEKTIKIRALCSSKDATHTWDLHCILREKMVAYICELEEGIHLPTVRAKIQENN
ncbi:mechanosensitive ion channel family protein [Mesonia sp. K7]|uniref:mechanosensitive ion channel family protein n=1 Tax=Mesonia sp. K7 TaxID=2218606 RepID=UPI000DA9097E|nr:mechanosensitive ion channel domain-containing protein [Mesonia sp. K7]PZD77931.1 mechanosensitive ion channel protein [Mesonia sp. K7]